MQSMMTCLTRSKTAGRVVTDLLFQYTTEVDFGNTEDFWQL